MRAAVERTWPRIGLLILLLLFLVPAVASAQQGAPQERPLAAPQGTGDVAAEYWRTLRQGGSGYSAATGQSDLINVGGSEWMVKRNETVTSVGAYAFAIFFGLVVGFYLTRGTVRVENGFSGRTVERWPFVHRVIHWWVAITFLLQLVSGLVLLYGKDLLLPLFGKEFFGVLANLSKTSHNYIGPIFFAGLVVMFVAWLRHNMPKAVDFKWFAKGGGLVGKGHPSAGFLNGGEKVWFWGVVVLCGISGVTGLVLNFPNFEQTRETMQLMHYLHTLTGLVIGAASIAHIYIATLGTEGAMEGMKSGHVDVEWAKQHHDLWYAEISGEPLPGPKEGPVTAAEPREVPGGGSASPA